MVQRAKAEEAARIATASTISVPRDSLGRMYSHAPRLHFETIEHLGEGTYSYVSKVKETYTGTFYAQKVLRVTDPRIRNRIRQQVENEVNIMNRLSHQHITKISLWGYEPDGDFFSIVMLPVADYNLQQFLQEKCVNAAFPRTELSDMTTWFGCLISALSFAHANDIKHEDIKPGNILIKNQQPFLADFGSAKDFSDTHLSASENHLAYGTPVYWAPENPPRGRAADVFALGCVFSEMLTVRQRHTLKEYQNARYQPHRDSPFAFRGNLPRVYTWIEELRRDGDQVADLLVNQTLEMLSGDYLRRPKAANVKRKLMAEHRLVMCTVCSS
jgi:serine/threonine protein kinase